MLGCLANICNQQIARETLDLTMALLSHSKPLIRKKAAAVIGKMFMLAPELIPNNLEKIIGKIAAEEHSSNKIRSLLSYIIRLLIIICVICGGLV